MKNWEFIELDSAKGERLLDIAAFQDWQSKQHENIDPDGIKKRDQLYDEMRAEVRERYNHLKDNILSLTVLQARRLFQYLQGQSLAEIAQSENPQVERQAVYNALLKICKKWGWTAEELNQAKAIWEYGKAYFE